MDILNLKVYVGERRKCPPLTRYVRIQNMKYTSVYYKNYKNNAKWRVYEASKPKVTNQERSNVASKLRREVAQNCGFVEGRFALVIVLVVGTYSPKQLRDTKEGN